MTDIDTSPEAVEWPNEIWAEDREDSYCGLYRISVYAAVNERREYARYVHHGVHESLQKYHGAMVTNLRAEIASLSAALEQSRAETAAAYERAAVALDAVAGQWSCGHSAMHCDCARDIEQWGFAADEVRAIATTDHTAALDQMIAEAEARGMRKAAAIAERVEEALRQGYAATSANAVGEVYLAILAAIPKGGDA